MNISLVGWTRCTFYSSIYITFQNRVGPSTKKDFGPTLGLIWMPKCLSIKKLSIKKLRYVRIHTIWTQITYYTYLIIYTLLLFHSQGIYRLSNRMRFLLYQIIATPIYNIHNIKPLWSCIQSKSGTFFYPYSSICQ